MSNIIDGSKSTLGKLLASENIRIEHRQIRGPYFDVKERVLALPIWKDVDGDLYDLMIGHEVGHALFTPEDGWLDQVEEEGMEYKTFLNLVEDARIEKLMKRKYPGLRKPMYNGYTNLVERDFFGVTLEDMKNLPFADRMNVYFKLGVRANVAFNAEEQDLVDRIEMCETWDEVMLLAKELRNLSKKEKEDLGEDLSEALDELEDMINNDDFEIGDGSFEPQESNSKTLEDIVQDLRDKGKTEAADKLEKKMSQKMQRKMSEWANSDENYSITQQSFEENQETLIDEKSYPITYTSWPKLDIEQWVIPAHITHNNMKFSDKMEARGNSIYQEFMNNNRRYVSYLVKEFELRRNAKQFAKASVSKTGKLDTEKVWKYKLSDDLFLRSTVVPNGKNHGMLMVVDMSSSMHDNMSGTLEQIVSLSMFCRKVNIPFDVYGFTDNNSALEEFREKGIDITSFISPNGMNMRNDKTPGSLHIHSHDFRLKQLLHHKMKLVEYNKAVRNLLMLASCFNNRSYSYYGYGEGAPKNMQLCATPFNETILVLRYIAEKFKKDTQVEILNTIILTDGDASYSLGIAEKEENKIAYLTKRNVIVDKVTRKEIEAGNREKMTLPLLELYKQITGSRVIGFYLMGGRNHKATIRDMMYRKAGNMELVKLEEQYKKEFLTYKYFGLKLQGYDVFYMVPGEELEIENITMDKVLTAQKNTNQKNTLLKAFKKMQNTKNVSRVFLNQFIQQVS